MPKAPDGSSIANSLAEVIAAFIHVVWIECGQLDLGRILLLVQETHERSVTETSQKNFSFGGRKFVEGCNGEEVQFHVTAPVDLLGLLAWVGGLPVRGVARLQQAVQLEQEPFL